MDALERVKALKDARSKATQWEPEDVYIGAVIITDDGASKTMINAVCGPKIFVNGDWNLTLKDLFDGWLVETPGGLAICGKPKAIDIITPDFKLVT